MAYKDLLLHLTSYPQPTPPSAVDFGVSFARLVGSAKLTALTFEIEIHLPPNALANTLINTSALAAEERARSASSVHSLLNLSATAAAERKVTLETVVEHSMTSDVPEIVTEYARLQDLTMIPIDTAASFPPYIAQAVIFGSGRPVLIFPASRVGEASLDSIGIAWDYSRPAARAVADALPLLKRAKKIVIVTITQEKLIETRHSGAQLVKHLASHGIEATVEEVPAGGKPIGKALEAYAMTRQLDLLVMGAYGHSRIRDFLLGGATKSIVANPPIPVLLSH